jgi:putative transposase
LLTLQSSKTEWVWHRDQNNHSEATADGADYIVGFCNSVRHFKLGKLPQNAFEQQSAIKQPIAVSEKA